MDRQECLNCSLKRICTVYKYFCTIEAADKLKNIVITPDHFAQAIQGIRESLASNCNFFKKIK